MSESFQAGSIVAQFKAKLAEWKSAVRIVKRDTLATQANHRKMTVNLAKNWKKIGQGAAVAAKKFGLLSAAALAAGAVIARSFLDAARQVENYRIVLTRTLGSQEEAERLFQDMRDYASKVSFELEEIIGGAVTLSGVMKGGADQITAWMPLIGDLAALGKTLGVSFEESIGQIVRMFSAGVGAADLFRDKGITAMLGFKAKVAYTAEETQQMLIEAWTEPGSKFKDMAKDLSTTWDGTVSMLKDKWFTFRTAVMDTGLYSKLKAGLESLNNYVAENKAAIDDWIKTHAQAIETTILLTGAVTGLGTALGGIALIAPTVIQAMKGIRLVALTMWASVFAPAGATVAAVAAVVAVFYVIRAEFKRNVAGMREEYDRFVASVKDTIEPLREVFSGLWGWIADGTKDTINGIIGLLAGLNELLSSLVFGQMGDFEAALEKAKIARAYDYIGDLSFGVSTALRDDFENIKMAGSATAAQLKDDFTAAFNAIKAKMGLSGPSFEDTLQTWFGGGDTMPDIAAMLGGATAGGEEDKAAAKALERSIEHGESLYLTLDKVAGAYEDIAGKVQSLKAAGRYSDDVRSFLAVELWEDLANMSTGALDAVLEKAKGVDAELVAAIRGAQTAAREAAQTELADDLLADISPRDMVAELTEAVTLLKETGRLDDETGNLLAAHFWEEFSQMSTETMGAALMSMTEMSPELQSIADQMRGLKAKSDAASKSFLDSAQNLAQVGYQMNQVGDTMGVSIVKKLGAMVNGISTAISGLGEMKTAFDALRSNGEKSVGSIIGQIGNLASGALGAVGAVAGLAESFGLLGDETEEVAKGLDRVFEELENSLNQWADRLTDVIIDFVKTGEFEMEKFVASVMEDILRITIRYAYIEPLVEAAAGAFAKGAVFQVGNVVPFASGGVVATPTAFPMSGGRTGVMGEAGPEAVMPLKRLPSGDLGIQAAGGGTVVNVIDQRSGDSPPVHVERSRGADGREEVKVFVYEAVKEGILSGEFDGANELAFGLSRGGF